MRSGANRGFSSNTSQGGGDGDTTTSINYSDNTGSSLSEQLSFQVLPQEFTTLRQGGPSKEVDAIVFKPGRVWRGSGTNFIRVTFRQSA